MDAFAKMLPPLRQALLAAGLLLSLASLAQERNPFELTPRLGLPPEPEAPAAIADTGNPFDLIAPSAAAVRPAAPSPATAPQAVRPAAPAASADAEQILQRLLLVVVLSILLLLTILMTLLRSFLGHAYKAFLNDNLLSQLQRKSEGSGAMPYYLFYAWSITNIGLFFFLLCQYYGISLGWYPGLELGACIALAAGLFLAKHLALSFLAAVFPIRKEVRLYHFTIVIFTIMLGMFLLVANMLIALVPDGYTQTIVYIAYGGIVSLYLFRALRGAIIGQQFIYAHFFHFLLYLCAVEIAPVVVLAKLIKDLSGA